MRLAVIGLDGAAWHVLKPVLERGVMPAFGRISKNSLSGVLRSTIPPTTPPAWTSIATGVNPGKHGVFGFIKVSIGGRARILTSDDVKYPRVHEMAALKNLKAVCVNQPLTYPVLKMKNLSMITDWIGPEVQFYPRRMEAYRARFKPYEACGYVDRDEFLRNLSRNAEERQEAVVSMLESLDWNLFWIVISEPDLMLHRCYDEVVKGHEEVDFIFACIDRIIKAALEVSDYIVIVSDHGFAKYKYLIYVNTLLFNRGLVSKSSERKAHPEVKPKVPVRRVAVPQKIYKIVSWGPLKKLIKKVYRSITGVELRGRYYYPDPEKSIAFMPSRTSFGVYVRERSLIPEVIRILRSSDYFSGVWRREEIYRGPYVEDAPNIIIIPDFEKGFYLGFDPIIPMVKVATTNYNHHPEGVILLYGRDTPRGWLTESAAAEDVAPTILSLLGLPLPADMDGRPLVKPKNKERFNYLGRWRMVKRCQKLVKLPR